MENVGKDNKLTNEEPNHRKMESLKSNIFSLPETNTNKAEKLEVKKEKYIADKIFDVFEKKSLDNKRKELCSHFTLGENVEFNKVYENLGEYSRKDASKIDNPNEDKKKDM